MLDTILNIVKEKAGAAIINNPSIPNEKNDEAIGATASSIMKGLQNQLAKGNVGEIVKLLGGKSEVNQSPATAKIMEDVASDLGSKFGLSSAQATTMVSSLLPDVISSMVKKTNDPNDKSIDLSGMISTLTNGKTSGMDLTKILDKDGDGSSLDDLASMISGGAKSAMTEKGGISKILGGLFGK